MGAVSRILNGTHKCNTKDCKGEGIYKILSNWYCAKCKRDWKMIGVKKGMVN